MIETLVQTSYGSLDVSSKGIGPTTRPKAPTEARSTAATALTTPAIQGIGFASYVVAPSTLLAAQEARENNQIRRDDSKQDNQGTASGDAQQSATGDELTPEEEEVVAALKKVDQEVRAHEQAHRAAGGSLTGGAQFNYVRGPDGQMYAVSGEVSIDTGREASASATAAKMEQVIRAALAPANPSARDLAVAAQARQILTEVSQEAREERQNLDGESNVSSSFQDLTNTNAAHQAYRNQGAQDGQNFLAQQARNTFQISAENGFNITI